MSDGSDIREVVEGIKVQGEDEIIVYTIDVTNWGDSPTSPTVVVKDMNDSMADVTSTVMPTGSPSVNSNVITLPALKLLTADRRYRVEVKFTLAGNVLETYFVVSAQS
jgi:hypothetical protein